MSTDRDRVTAGKAIVAKVVADDVRKFTAAVRADMENMLGANEAIAAELPDGSRVGTVKRSKPRQSAAVVDPDALLEWVREHRPDELVESVSPAFVAWLVQSAKTHGAAVLADGTVVPGVEPTVGAPSYLPQVDEGAADLIRARLAELVGGGLLALPGQETPA